MYPFIEPKVLIAAPINIIKEYCLYEWLDCLKQLDYTNYEIFLVDNSENPAFCQKIKDLGFNCLHEPPKGRGTRYYMASSLERCRVKFLDGDYDYFFSLECDIFPPKDIIQRLLAHKKPVVGTTYYTDHGWNTHLQLQLIYEWHTDYKKRTKDYRVRFLTLDECQLFIDGKCKPMYACGIGCTLIERAVLENIKFRIDPLDMGFADSFFHRDIWEMGIDNFVDTSIIPIHKNSNWNDVAADAGHKKIQAARGDIKLKSV